MSRHGLEEYVSDCVILLDHRIENQISTRRLRVVKYRGSRHGADEYPFLIEEGGIVVFPITSLGLVSEVAAGHISSGIAELDEALDGKGFPRGSSILVTGTAGTGKTSLAAAFVDSACRAGQRCLYFSMEESPQQLVHNMRSIGLDLGHWCEKDLLRLESSRPTLHGLEMHLATVHARVAEYQPDVVVMDPISGFTAVGTNLQITALLTRMLDFLKSRQITAFVTALVSGSDDLERSVVGVSSWMDAWIAMRTHEFAGSRRRGLYVIKVRGMQHSNRMHELFFSADGIRLGPMGDLQP
jgi:circadian clock protein KaiC